MKNWSWTHGSSVRDREVLRATPLYVVARTGMFRFLKGVAAPSLEQK